MDPASKQAAKYKTQSLFGIINDKMEVGMAKIRGEESAALDVAIIKATIQDEVVPKEKHVRTLKIACSAQSPRQVVNYAIHGLYKRLEENPKAWLVTLKTLIVFHRLMRETDPGFQLELLNYAERTGRHRMLRLESFADHTTKETWDYSAWIRVYSLYLDERQAAFRTMRFDPEHEQAAESRESKLRSCSASELLEYLPAMQRLLRQLVSCVPEGAAQGNEISLLACSLVLKEVRPVYKVVCEGILNLVDRIFEMDRGDALKGVELVKENLTLNDRLNAFVSTVGSIQPLKGAVQFPSVQPLPTDFLTTLEEYVKDAPKSTSEVGKPGAGRTASTTVKSGPRLIVGGPLKDPPSGPASPPPLAAPPAPAPEVDLLGGFEALTVGGPALVPTSAPAPRAPAAAAFDPFVTFAPAPLTPPAAATAPAAPIPPPSAPAPAPAPAASYSLAASSSFANPAAAAVAAGLPGVSQPPGMSVPPSSSFNDAAFGAANAFGAPPPSMCPPTTAVPPPPPLPDPASSSAAPQAQFNPFANPTMHATVAAHMPPPPAPSPQPFAPLPPLLPQHMNTLAQSPAPASAPQTPAGSQTPVAPPYATGPGAAFAGGPGAASFPPPGCANPFSSPGGPAPQPAAAVYSPPSAPSPTNPFGAVAAPAAGGTTGGANPFAAAPGGVGWAGGAAPTTMTQVGGYTLKKPADPLNDLSLDLFGKPQAPLTQQPMRPQMGAPQSGSPGAFF